MAGWADGQMVGWADWQVAGWADWKMAGWADGLVDGCKQNLFSRTVECSPQTRQRKGQKTELTFFSSTLASCLTPTFNGVPAKVSSYECPYPQIQG